MLMLPDTFTHETQGFIALIAFNLLMLLCLGKAWLIGATPKTSRVFAGAGLVLCGIALYLMLRLYN